ncbi:DUF4064 domain-containing protein [Listeria monocytogenes]|nr:DUF4064 domain-containing protein [Listeria monocytogenes]EAG4643018.1 DUF4064 domain-containing protein [Listeria monocytogenes]EJT8453877.1 DUF4064 domain-containing protein [Listeria monocytogenes]
MSRKTEFVLGLIGGITGILTAILVMTIGGAASLFEADGAYSVTTTGFIALLFSILGLVGACIVKEHHLLGSTFMISAALGGTISISLFYIVPLVLFAIAGLMGMIRGGRFTSLFKKWWFYLLIAAAIIIPIIGYTSSHSDRTIANKDVSSTSNTSSEATDDSVSDGSTDSDEGTRANPMPLNSPLSLTGTMMDTDTFDKFEASMDITLTETIRGDKAWKLIKAENQFNEAPSEGKEYILNKIKVKAYGIASSENKFNMSKANFKYISGTGTTYSSGISAVIPNELNATLYNDATGEGYIYGVVDKSDNAPLVKYLQFYFKTN